MTNSLPIKDIPQNLGVLNIVKIFCFLIPFLLIFCILCFSIFTNNILKGLVFLSGIVVVSFLNMILKNILRTKSETRSPYCNFFPTPFSVFNASDIYISPSTNATLISFIATYLLVPLYVVSKQYNLFLMILFVLLFLINSISEWMEGCVTLFSIALGLFTGILFGYLFYLIVKLKDDEKLKVSYFLDIKSNRSFCRADRKKNYKCVIKQQS